jgi:hypothetical protein
MRTLTLCLLALALAAPSVATAQAKKSTKAKPQLQLVLAGDEAVPGIQYPVFVYELGEAEGHSKALLVNAKTKADAQKKLAAATGLPASTFAGVEAGTVVKPGGPNKGPRGFIGLEQDGIHMATYDTVMKCDVDIRKDCTSTGSTLGAAVSAALSAAEVKAAVGQGAPATTKMRKGRAKKRPVAPDPRWGDEPIKR